MLEDQAAAQRRAHRTIKWSCDLSTAKSITLFRTSVRLDECMPGGTQSRSPAVPLVDARGSVATAMVGEMRAASTGEAGLVVAARAGDRRALDELISVYLPFVYNIVGRAIGQARW